MKRQLLILVIALSIAAPAAAGAPRILEGSVDAEDLKTIRLDAGVGDIDVTAVADGNRVAVTVELRPRRGGFFSSMKKAQREVDEAVLKMQASKGVLRLEISSDTDDRHFEENWTIELPARVAFDLDLGVGDTEIRDLVGELGIEVGVGDVFVEGVSGDINIEIGVGDATVEAAAANYGSVAGSGGVGDAKLIVRGERVSSSGFVGHSAEWTGAGEHYIEIEVGVGDARVTLE